MKGKVKQTIYALVYEDPSIPDPLREGIVATPFYVGRTGGALDKRHAEHRASSKLGTRDVYVFIRQLAARGIDFHIETLASVDVGDDAPYEHWYVIEYIRKGYDLKNMRLGDKLKVADEITQGLASDSTIDSAVALKRRLAPQSTSSRTKSSSPATQVRALSRTLRDRGEVEIESGNPSQRWRKWDTGEGTEEILAASPMSRKEVAELHTPISR